MSEQGIASNSGKVVYYHYYYYFTKIQIYIIYRYMAQDSVASAKPCRDHFFKQKDDTV